MCMETRITNLMYNITLHLQTNSHNGGYLPSPKFHLKAQLHHLPLLLPPKPVLVSDHEDLASGGLYICIPQHEFQYWLVSHHLDHVGGDISRQGDHQAGLHVAGPLGQVLHLVLARY